MTNLPPGYKWYAEPYFQPDGSHWIVNFWTPDNGEVPKEVMSGYGVTKEQAVADAISKAQKHQEFWDKTDTQRLEQHLEDATKQGRFYDRQLLDVLKILARRT